MSERAQARERITHLPALILPLSPLPLHIECLTNCPLPTGKRLLFPRVLSFCPIPPPEVRVRSRTPAHEPRYVSGPTLFWVVAYRIQRAQRRKSVRDATFKPSAECAYMQPPPLCNLLTLLFLPPSGPDEDESEGEPATESPQKATRPETRVSPHVHVCARFEDGKRGTEGAGVTRAGSPEPQMQPDGPGLNSGVRVLVGQLDPTVTLIPTLTPRPPAG